MTDVTNASFDIGLNQKSVIWSTIYMYIFYLKVWNTVSVKPFIFAALKQVCEFGTSKIRVH
jgi:hypothetical protein